ncbi:MAG: hypothetical protein ABL958_10055 [Bdellovibrionia bacterium]
MAVILSSASLPWSVAKADWLIAQMTDQENEITEEDGEGAAVEETTQAADAEVAPTPVAPTDAAAPTESAAAPEEEVSAFATSEEGGEGDDEVILYLKPYRKRRTSWGSYVSVGYNGYSPKDYNPSFVLDRFDTYYGNAETPYVEFAVSPKKNFSFASFSLDLGVGYYDNRAPDSSQLTLIPARAGIGLALDTLFDEPYVVPYGSFGVYTMLYKETFAAQSVSGNTAIGLYYCAGMRIQLDWIDSDGDLASYDENGMENTFVFVEARSFLLPNSSEPDLGSPEEQPFGIGAGFTLEF